MRLSAREKEVILALADNDMNVSAASVKLFQHRNTTVYNIEKIKRKTGLNPMIFYDLVKLVEAAKKDAQDIDVENVAC